MHAVTTLTLDHSRLFLNLQEHSGLYMMILEHSSMEFSTANQNEVESSRIFQIVHDASGTF